MTIRLHNLLFATIFGLTGVGTALLGATLPAILHDWRLTDARGGLLLLAAWGGSTSGAAFAHAPEERSTGVGLACSALALLALPFAPAAALPLLYALFGLGLGITMTSISLMRAREASPGQTDVELNRLNLVWASGALCAPALALHSLRLLSIARLFQALGGLFGMACIAAVAFSLLRPACDHSAAPPQTQHPSRMPLVPWRFCLFAAACVGLESGIGSWLTTYAERIASGVGAAVSANAAFWAGLLLSRAVHSFRSVRAIRTRAARATHIVFTTAATIALILFPSPTLLPLTAFVCGLGLGPLYPYVLSVALPRYRSTAIFVMAGIGASVTPWLTGMLSSVSGSLRVGLLAPAAVLILLAGASLQMRSELGC